MRRARHSWRRLPWQPASPQEGRFASPMRLLPLADARRKLGELVRGEILPTPEPAGLSRAAVLRYVLSHADPSLATPSLEPLSPGFPSGEVLVRALCAVPPRAGSCPEVPF